MRNAHPTMLCEKKLIKRLNREYDRVPFSRKNSVSRQIVPLQMDFQTGSKYVQVYCVYEQKNSFSERSNYDGGVFFLSLCVRFLLILRIRMKRGLKDSLNTSTFSYASFVALTAAMKRGLKELSWLPLKCQREFRP